MIENGNFLIYDNQGQSVFLFDNNGRFLNFIGQRGNGPQEYTTLEDVVYDEYNKEVIVWDQDKKNLMFFKLNGSFIKSIKLERFIGSFQVMDKNRIALYFNNRVDVKDKSTQSYNINIIDRNGVLLDQMFPYSLKREAFNPACKEVFSVYNNRILCNPSYSPNVYELDSCGLKPKYILDFGGNTIHPSMYDNKSNSEFHQILGEYPEKVFCADFRETENAFVMNLIRDRIMYFYLQSKNSSSGAKSSLLLFNDMYGLVSGVQIMGLKNDHLITAFYPYQFDQYKKILDKSKNNEDVKKMLIESIVPKTDLFENLKNRIKKSNIKITKEEKEFILNVSDSDNPILQISRLITQ